MGFGFKTQEISSRYSYIRLVDKIMVTISDLIYVQIDTKEFGLSKKVLVRGKFF